MQKVGKKATHKKPDRGRGPGQALMPSSCNMGWTGGVSHVYNLQLLMSSKQLYDYRVSHVTI